MRLFNVITVLLLLGWRNSSAQPDLVLESFATGLSSPIGIAHAGDDRLFVLQQRGLIRIINPDGRVKSNPFLDLTAKVSATGGERGLLGMAFHPAYSDSGFFYVNYTRASDGATVVSRFSVSASDPDQADASSEQILFTVSQPVSNHNGGCMLFGPDGYLYIGMGDGGGAGDTDDNAQNTALLLGKMLRIDPKGNSYGIPPDNPFVGASSVRNEIWAIGLRNPWRFSFDRLTGDLWTADVGQDAREEINFQPSSSAGGENYGWRCYEGNNEYNLSGCEPVSSYAFPVFQYPHAGDPCSGSVTGGSVYRGALHNGLFGKYIVADYCKGSFYWVERTDTGFVSGSLGTFSPTQYSSFGEDRHGELYVTLLGSGGMRKVTDTSDCRPVAMILSDDTLRINEGETLTLSALYHPALNYQWRFNGNDISGASSESFVADSAGDYSVEVTNPGNSCSNTTSVRVEIGEETGIPSVGGEGNIFKIFPNPSSGSFIIETKNLSLKIETAALMSMIGESLLTFNGRNSTRLEVETTGLKTGMYLVKIKTNGGYHFKKIVLN